VIGLWLVLLFINGLGITLFCCSFWVVLFCSGECQRAYSKLGLS
jgi:hypothetical protein